MILFKLLGGNYVFAGIILVALFPWLSGADNDDELTSPRLVRRNFLRFGKRNDPGMTSTKRAGENPEVELNSIRPIRNNKPHIADNAVYDLQNPYWKGDGLKRGRDNFLRFGKRTVLDALLAHLLTMNVDDESIDKRAKDFLRFG